MHRYVKFVIVFYPELKYNVAIIRSGNAMKRTDKYIQDFENLRLTLPLIKDATVESHFI